MTSGTTFYRSVLFVAGAGMLSFKLFLTPLVPDAVDPWSLRLGLTLVAWVPAAASFFVPAVRARLYRAVVAIAYGVTAWAVWVTAVNRFNPEYAVGAVLVFACAMVLLETWRETVICALLAGGTTLLALAVAAPEDRMHGGLVLLSVVVMALLIGLAVRRREQLAVALLDSARTLERRVEERTRELATEAKDRRLAEERALAASRAKSAFLASMSHELRTPLTAITGYADLVCEELGEADTAVVERDVGHIHDAAVHLLGIVDQVLDLARIEAGKVELRPRSVNVAQVVREAIDTARTLAERNGNRFVVELETLPPWWTDPDRLRQVLVNLLGNAAKFTTDGTIRVAGGLVADRLVLQISDTGCGIAPERLESVFHRFVRSPTEVGGGAGLGLAICRDLAALLGGELTVVSAVGAGTEFTLRLPPGRDDTGGDTAPTGPTG